MIIHDDAARPSWSLTPRERGRALPGSDEEDIAEWQRVWLRAQSRDWRTLALVPADDGVSAFDVAHVIARLALEQGEFIHVADVRDLRLAHVDAFLDGTRWDAAEGDRIVFATRPSAGALVAVRLARAADCAILCASLGSTSLGSIRDTVEQIGREHFLGSLLVRTPHPPGRRAPRPVTAKGRP